jgi:hypothetical protein
LGSGYAGVTRILNYYESNLKDELYCGIVSVGTLLSAMAARNNEMIITRVSKLHNNSRINIVSILVNSFSVIILKSNDVSINQ